MIYKKIKLFVLVLVGKRPFETWDAIGVEKVFNEMLKLKLKLSTLG